MAICISPKQGADFTIQLPLHIAALNVTLTSIQQLVSNFDQNVLLHVLHQQLQPSVTNNSSACVPQRQFAAKLAGPRNVKKPGATLSTTRRLPGKEVSSRR